MDILLDIIDAIDYDILLLISEHLRGGASDLFWKLLSLLGNYGALWIALGLILLFFRKTRRAGIAVLLSLVFSLLIGNLLIKPLVMRPRPFVTYPDLIALLDPGDRWSFPSAHTLSAFAASAALFSYHRKSGLLAFLVGALIGFSRLYACVHYPTDVLCGAVIGIICGLAAAWLADHAIDLYHRLRLRRDT